MSEPLKFSVSPDGREITQVPPPEDVVVARVALAREAAGRGEVVQVAMPGQHDRYLEAHGPAAAERLVRGNPDSVVWSQRDPGQSRKLLR